MLWHLLESMFNCCELEDSLPGLIVQKWKLSMLAESTCESFNRTVLPFTLEAKGIEACYFQPRQDFRLTRICCYHGLSGVQHESFGTSSTNEMSVGDPCTTMLQPIVQREVLLALLH